MSRPKGEVWTYGAMLSVPPGVDPIGDYIAELAEERDFRLARIERERQYNAAQDEDKARVANRVQLNLLRRALRVRKPQAPRPPRESLASRLARTVPGQR